jgi:hypothetical protein
LPPELAAVLGRGDRTPAALALDAAVRVLTEIRRTECLFEPHIGISREGSVVLTFCRDKKLASYECDADGEVTLLLSDRGSESDPFAELLSEPQIGLSARRARAFLS